jgi:hypothetical protein
VNEEQKARLQEARDDAERNYRQEDDEIVRRILRAKVETLETVAYIFGVELDYFDPHPTPKLKCTCRPLNISHVKGCPFWVETL